MSYVTTTTKQVIATAFEQRDPQGLISWIRTLAASLGHEDLATGLPTPPFRTWLRSAAGAPLTGNTTQQLLEALSLPSLALVATICSNHLHDIHHPRSLPPAPSSRLSSLGH